VLHRNAFSLGFLVLMIQIGIFEVKTGTAGAMQRFFSKKIWRGLSQVAFPMYLFHFPMMIPAAALVFGTLDYKKIPSATLPQIFAVYGLVLAMTFGLSVLLHIILEKPLMRWGSKLSRFVQVKLGG
jgi:peptidoglycan/LPS O-acetylase OafA/YrhL